MIITHPTHHPNTPLPPAQTSKPRDFASQIQLNMDNCWGTVRALVDVVFAMDEGKYLLVKVRGWVCRCGCVRGGDQQAQLPTNKMQTC